MRLVVILVAALIVGVAALGLILAQKRGTPTTAAVSTVRIASATQEGSALPPVRQSVKLPKRRVPKRRPSFCGPTSTRNPAAQ